MKIETVATIAKGFNLKREKTDDGEVVYAHLKFSDMFITREEIDGIVGMPEGWARDALFDPYGAPRFGMDIALPGAMLSVVGTIGGAESDEQLKLMQADLSGIALWLTTNGALVSGTLTWTVAGDEASDVEPLLGRICSAKLTLRNRQGDLLRQAA